MMGGNLLGLAVGAVANQVTSRNQPPAQQGPQYSVG